ncbi:hypothetical protein F5Y14DRAFT_419390 [Nemania sp. NC0429]|nr:hypothetical protein F5Y14DRAFT_419390 [Nemania sp. NC0429]
MADPVGAAGTAVGVVSLGLQLYTNLKQYIDGINSRDERVTKTLAYIEHLKAILVVIDAATQSFQAQQPAPADAVLSGLSSCEAEMQVLQQKLREVESSQQSSVKGKIKEIRKKLEYPFQIPILEEIEKSVKRITDGLLLATQGLGLHSDLKISSNIDALANVTKSQGNALAKLSIESDTIQKAVDYNASQLIKIDSRVQPIEPKLQALETVTNDRFNILENQVYQNHSITTARLDMLESHTGTSAQVLTEVLNILRNIERQPAPLNQDSIGRHLVGALVSKPSLLRDMHKSSDLHQEAGGAASNLHTDVRKLFSATSTLVAPVNCGCTPRRRVSQKSSRWYPFDFFSTEEMVSRHRPGCSQAMDWDFQRQQTLGVTFFGLRRLLSAAISVSLSLHHGAGGTSISPMFRHYSVVDEEKSAPFKMTIALYRAMNTGGEMYKASDYEKLIMYYISWIREAYSRRVASPHDVSIDGLTLVDFVIMLHYASHWLRPFQSPIFAHILSLGVKSTRQQPLIQMFNQRLSKEVVQSYGRPISLLLQKTPECHYQWQASSINLLQSGDFVRQSSEILEVMDLDPLCASLLCRDLTSFSQLLATGLKHDRGQYKPTKSLNELLIWWPEALKYMLETVPDFFSSGDLKALFKLATEKSNYRCQTPSINICEGCSCSEAVIILLDHGCPLMSEDIRPVFEHDPSVSPKVRYEVLRHLAVWRRKLYELFSLVYPQGGPETQRPGLLDDKAPYVVRRLQEVGLDPYEEFSLERGDYRLGSSLHCGGTIYHITDNSTVAKMAFNIGFRDVDAVFEGVTPLSRVSSNYYYREYVSWLIHHGANYSRELTFITEDRMKVLSIIEPPRYRIVHWIFRSILAQSLCYDGPDFLDTCVTGMVQNPWFSHFNKSIYHDGCSCVCSSSPEGCSPLVIYFNQIIQHEYLRCSKKDLGSFGDMVKIVSMLVGAIEPLPKLAEAAIRCLTFNRLRIRHTCCASIPIFYSGRKLPADYGSDFDELREEDECRVEQLNQLMTGFMRQYRESSLSLTDFINEQWAVEMDRLEAEEKKMLWTTQEKDVLLSLGVLPKDGMVDNDKSNGKSNKKCRGAFRACECRARDLDSKIECWNRKFEMIVKGSPTRGKSDRCCCCCLGR